MGCGSSVIETVPPAALATGASSTTTAKPLPASASPTKKSEASSRETQRLSATSFRRTSIDDFGDDDGKLVKRVPVGGKGDGDVSAMWASPSTRASMNIDVDAFREDIPMMESVSGGSSTTSSGDGHQHLTGRERCASSSSSDSFGDKNFLMDANGNTDSAGLTRVQVGGASTAPRGSLMYQSDPLARVTRPVTLDNGSFAAEAASPVGTAHKPDSTGSGRASVSLMSESELNQSFDGRLLGGSVLLEALSRPASGLATFAGTRHECALCGQTNVAYACDQCDMHWCEDCRFKPTVLETHPPDHTITALNDVQHCNASRTFAESSFCSSDAISGSHYGGGTSTLLYNPCAICGRSINDTEPVYRCDCCEFISCTNCFEEKKASHDHPVRRFQRRAKNSVQEKPLTLKKKTTDGNRIINDYVVVRLLGRGGNAKVKLVQHTKTRQFYALKILKLPKAPTAMIPVGDNSSNSSYGAGGQQRLSGPSPHTPALAVRGGGGGGGGIGGGNSARGAGQPTLEDMLREIAVMKFIDHPNIVQLQEVIEDVEAQRAYIIMEYCEGGAIYTHGDPPLPAETVRQYATDILRGLQHLHSQFLYHRDIKPANCLVDNHGTVKITDFGTTNSNITTGQTGTLAYCCPEERKGEPYTGDVKDSWAFAITLYQLAYGRLPFDRLDYIAVRQALGSSESFPFPCDTHVDPDLRDLLEKMLCKDRSRRMLISTAASHPYFVDSRECSQSTSSTPIAPGRQQLQRGSVMGLGPLPGHVARLSKSDPADEGDDEEEEEEAAADRNKALYDRATASVIRGRNLLEAFHGTKSIQHIRQREANHAHSTVAMKIAVAAAAASAAVRASSAGEGGPSRAPGEGGSSTAAGLTQSELDLLDDDAGSVFDDDEAQSTPSTLNWETESALQVDRSLPSLMSRSQSMPTTQRNSAHVAAYPGAVTRPGVSFHSAMTTHQQEVILDIIRAYQAQPDATRRVLRVTDVLMLSPPSEQVESVANTAVGLHFARTALANFGTVDLSQFNALKDITLSSNRLTEIPDAVLDAPRLLRLDLSDNRIRHVPPSLRHARFLQRLNLHGNNISEVGADADGNSYFSSSCLRHVRLSSNPLTALPRHLETTTKLELVLDAIPALTEEWDRVIAGCRHVPPPAVIIWDDSFPQQLPSLPVPVWVATAPLFIYRSHILKACGTKHLVIPRNADPRFPGGFHPSRTLEVYFQHLLRTVYGMQQADIVASSPVHGGARSRAHASAAPSALPEATPPLDGATSHAETEAERRASAEQKALAVAVVADSWSPLPSVVGKAARAYVTSYFFVSETPADKFTDATGLHSSGSGGGGGSDPGQLNGSQEGAGEGSFEDLRQRMVTWLKAGESFLCFVPQASRGMREELTVTLGLALEDAFGEEWGEARFDRWLDTYGVV